MIELIKKLLIKYKELLLYGIFGVITTLINIVTFNLFYEIMSMPLLVANTLAWILAFLFAFFSNKLWVFESKEWTSSKAIREMLQFLTARLLTLLLDSVIMWLLVDILLVNSIVSKLISSFITIAVNYLASKFVIFKKSKK